MNTLDKAAHDPERRRHSRLRLKIPVELSCPGKPPMRTTTDEISLCGCYIETMFTLELGTKLSLVFSLNQERIDVKGIVVTKHPQVGNGIDFVEMTSDDRLKLREYIAECERQAQL